MFEKITVDGPNTYISNDHYEVKITPKIFGGYILTKTAANNPLEIVEIRDIRVDLPEKDIVKQAKDFLKQTYDSIDTSNFNIQTT